MKRASLLLLACCLYCWATAQSSFVEDSLKRNLQKAVNIPDRMQGMYDLSVYYLNINNALSDQYAAQIIALADSSRQRPLMVKAYLDNAERCYDNKQVQQMITRGLQYAQDALKIATDNHLDEYTAWSYLCLAKGYRFDGDNDKALNYDNLAMSVATDSSVPLRGTIKENKLPLITQMNTDVFQC